MRTEQSSIRQLTNKVVPVTPDRKQLPSRIEDLRVEDEPVLQDGTQRRPSKVILRAD